MRTLRAGRRLATSALCLTALALAVSGCANKTSPSATSGPASSSGGPGGTPILVGEYGALTGANSTFGTSTAAGIQLALDNANKAGGVDSHPVQLAEGHPLDDNSKPDQARTAVEKLTSQDHPTAVLGEVASSASLAAAPVCNTAKVPMISPSSTNPKVTELPYIFRVCFVDQFQGYGEAKFAYDNLKARKAAIFQDVKNDYSTGLAQYFRESFTQMGGTIVDTESYSQGDPDFKAALTKIKAAGPDILVVPGYYGDIGPIARQARQVGLTVPLIGGDGWDSSKLIEGAGGPGGALEGSYFSDHYSVNSPDPLVQNFVSAYKNANNGQVPDALAALGYDAAGVLVDALKRTPKPADGDYASPDYRAKLRDAIAATKNYKGVTGTISIGPDRNAIKPLSILQIKGSQFALVATINPPSSSVAQK